MKLMAETLSINAFLICVSIILIVIALLQKNSNFLDVRSIISSHFRLFTASPLQCIVIFGVPLLLTVVALKKQPLTKDVVDTLNIVLSIFISMFFAMMGILSTLNNKIPNEDQRKDVTAVRKFKTYNLLLKETFNAVLFECILCIIVLAMSITLTFINTFLVSWQLVAISGIVYYLSLVIVFNILVIIKRIKVLFDNRTENSS